MSEAPVAETRTSSVPENELLQEEAKLGVGAAEPEKGEHDGPKMLAHFGRSGSAKQMIRQGSSSARRCVRRAVYTRDSAASPRILMTQPRM